MAVISDTLIGLLNYRIEQEELSSRIYLAMSTWLSFHGFQGAADLWKKYSDEEIVHSRFAYDYLLDLDILPTVPALEQPQLEFNSLPQVIALSYQHEVEVTKQCHDLARAAAQEGDFMTVALAQKYLTEQVEELAKTQYWIDRLEAFGADPAALRLLDNEMGA